MAVNLSDLIIARTRAQIVQSIIAELQAGGFPTTDYTTGAPERTLIEAEAAAQVDLWAAAVAIASGGLIDYATGAWLTLLAKQRYDLDRESATTTVGTLTLTNASANNYTITAGAMRFRGAGSNTYTNTTGGALNAAGTLSVTITADTAGADEGNDGAATITTILTPLPGVTCTNPASTFSAVTCSGTSTGTVTPTFGTPSSASWVVLILTTGQNTVATFKLSNDGGLTYSAPITTGGALANVNGTGLNLAFANGAVNPSFNAGESFTFTSQGTWYTTQGADEETDAELRARCKARWPGLSSTPTDDVYEQLALAGSTAVAKVRAVPDVTVPAQINITIAGTNGTVSDTGPGNVVDAVQDYIDARRPLTDVPVVSAASQQTVTLSGATVYVKAENLATAQQDAQNNIQTYMGSLDIGDGSTKKVRISQVIEAILRDSGAETDYVNGLLIDGVAADLGITANHVIVWSQTIATAITWATY